MKKLILFMAFMAMLCGCENIDWQQWPDGSDGFFPGGQGGFDPGQGGGMGQSGSFDSSALGELATFSVEPYRAVQPETESIPAGDDDFVENRVFKTEIQIKYNI
ncbi:MAG: hypothetical protein HUJ94_02530, partial [Bacteroidales bacterium]|nr:hypothetical protein [Bacteroidales bacterium]